MMRASVGWLFLLLCGGFPAFAGDGGELSRAQQTAVADVAGRVDLIKAVNRKIWDLSLIHI